MIRAVTFDLWGTIFNYAETIVERRLSLLFGVLKRSGFDPDVERIREIYVYTESLFRQSWERAERSFSPEERLVVLLSRLGISLLPADLKELLREIEEAVLVAPPDLVGGVEEAIGSLSQSCRLGIISDTGMSPGRVLRILLERVGLLSLFSMTLFSDEVGHYKPHPQIFRKALEGLAVLPAQAVHIGDDPQTDVKGAKRVGMKAILFNPAGSSERDIEEADAIIDSYHSLKEVIKGL